LCVFLDQQILIFLDTSLAGESRGTVCGREPVRFFLSQWRAWCKFYSKHITRFLAIRCTSVIILLVPIRDFVIVIFLGTEDNIGLPLTLEQELRLEV
jgi:hypothetical protein